MTSAEKIDAIPAWRRFLICTVLRRSQWKIARSFNAVAYHAIEVLGDYDLYEKAKALGNAEWAKLYRVTDDHP